MYCTIMYLHNNFKQPYWWGFEYANCILCSGVRFVSHQNIGYDTKRNLVERIQFRGSGEYEERFRFFFFFFFFIR